MEFNFTRYNYHSGTEALVETLANRANTTDKHFIRTVVLFYLSIITSTMRNRIVLAGNRPVPLNIYALALAGSGAGKGIITSELERLLAPLTTTFTEKWKSKREDYIQDTAAKLSAKNGTDLQEEVEKTRKIVRGLGVPLLWFEEATSPAFKQMRTALIKVPFGSLNFIVDEVFSVPYGDDVLQDLVKSYDIGSLKQKLIKHTPDAQRVVDDTSALVPANMLLFGTGSLLGDPTIQQKLLTQLESGLARRCMFALTPNATSLPLTATQRLHNLRNTNTSSLMSRYQSSIGNMIRDDSYCLDIQMDNNTELFLMEYQINCEERSRVLDNNILAIEMYHRYMRVAKIAGIYAAWDGVNRITIEHLKSAMKLVEDGGDSLGHMVRNEAQHIRLAKFLGKSGEVTMSQLVTELPWFGTKPKAVKQEMLQLATEYGHANNIIISQETRRGIEYIKGNVITTTNLDKIILSISADQAYNYQNGYITWDNLHTQVTLQGNHWCNHWMNNGHRSEDTTIEGFNMVVIDVDNRPDSPNNVPMSIAMELLKDYKYLIYSSKSSTPEFNRYRIILPLSHLLHMSADVFKDFMSNIYEWLPIPADEVTDQRSRKWLGYDLGYHYNEGKLLPALDFIPETERSIAHKKETKALASLNNLDRWTVLQCNNPDNGRNNTLLRYALLLADAGIEIQDIEACVLNVNKSIRIPLPVSEITGTIMVTVQRHILKTKPTV